MESSAPITRPSAPSAEDEFQVTYYDYFTSMALRIAKIRASLAEAVSKGGEKGGLHFIATCSEEWDISVLTPLVNVREGWPNAQK